MMGNVSVQSKEYIGSESLDLGDMQVEAWGLCLSLHNFLPLELWELFHKTKGKRCPLESGPPPPLWIFYETKQHFSAQCSDNLWSFVDPRRDTLCIDSPSNTVSEWLLLGLYTNCMNKKVPYDPKLIPSWRLSRTLCKLDCYSGSLLPSHNIPTIPVKGENSSCVILKKNG